jgi:hypothetical protein
MDFEISQILVYTFIFFMPKILGNSLDKFTKVVVLFTRSLEKLTCGFTIFLRFSRDFTRIDKVILLLKFHLFA